MSGNQTSLLAKLLATENITVQQQPGVKTAMFDLKNRVLILPIWQSISRDLEDLLIVHETGHALDTPHAEQYKSTTDNLAAKIFPNEKISNRLRSTIQGFLNVIEDIRIDKRQKRRYPGSRKNYLIGYKELIDRDFFGTARRDINTMNLIDRLNIYFKGGNIHHNITFTPEEKVFLKRCENLETFNEVVTLTEEIYLYCKQKLENQQEMEIDLIDSEDEEGEDDGDFNGDDFDWDDDENEDNGSASGSGEAQQGEGDLAPTGPGGSSGASSSDLPSNAPVAHTEETWQQKSQDIVKDENSAFVYLSMPNIDMDKAVNDYKEVLNDWRSLVSDVDDYYHISRHQLEHCRKLLTQWKMKEKDSISFLVKEFEQRKAAELYAKINIAKTGVIDTNKLHSYKYNDDIFRRVATIPKGKNHGFVMFLDWSGSMHYNLLDTLKQLFSLTLFCKQIGVPFEVYAFKDVGAEDPFSYADKNNVIRGANVVLRNFLSSRMNTEELNFAMSCLWFCGSGGNIKLDGMGGTPLNEALMIAPKVVNEFTARNKLEITNVIVLTDGEGNPGMGVMNETTVRVPGQNRRYFYVDPATRKTYDFFPWGYGSSSNNTNTLLRILKESTGCNLVGFYLFDRSFKWLNSYFNVSNGDSNAFVAARKQWNDNKFYPVRSAGYDEYYIINCDAIKNSKNELEIDNTGDKKMTTRKMVSAFTKFAQKKTINRVLLRQFVERIAGHSKKVA